MAVHSRNNEYRGVNAHLQSHFQNAGGWAGFHDQYIVDLARNLNAILPAGYLVDTEQSLQIREYHPDKGERIRRPEPDITIYRSEEKSTSTPSSVAAFPTLSTSIAETIELNEDLYYIAAVIYKVLDDETLGQPITRIEVLSPTNKPPGDGYLQYVEKRYAGLKSGLCMVEIDYMHETLSPLKSVPVYPQQRKSFPYYIAVTNPIPSFEEGKADIYGFHVEEPQPQIAIPLSNKDTILVDFGAVYNTTFTSLTAHSRRVDYSHLPDHFERYGESDQERIRALMERVVSRLSSVDSE